MRPQPEPHQPLRVARIVVAVLILSLLSALGLIVLLGLVGYLQERPDKAHVLDLLGIWVPIIGAVIFGIALMAAIVIVKKARAQNASHEDLAS